MADPPTLHDLFAHRRALAGIPDHVPRFDIRTPCGLLVSWEALAALEIPPAESPFVTCDRSDCVPCRAAAARLGLPE